jgi:hypothetical protein
MLPDVDSSDELIFHPPAMVPPSVDNSDELIPYPDVLTYSDMNYWNLGFVEVNSTGLALFIAFLALGVGSIITIAVVILVRCARRKSAKGKADFELCSGPNVYASHPYAVATGTVVDHAALCPVPPCTPCNTDHKLADMPAPDTTDLV